MKVAVLTIVSSISVTIKLSAVSGQQSAQSCWLKAFADKRSRSAVSKELLAQEFSQHPHTSGCGVWGVGCRETSYYFQTAFGIWKALWLPGFRVFTLTSVGCHALW
ncbi:MAG: hypothetical protein F6J93_36415 [Oscillatoria sp. SIO1A7]|nr:hypothetical protein [Oscillatoria sp. SIO1A7]